MAHRNILLGRTQGEVAPFVAVPLLGSYLHVLHVEVRKTFLTRDMNNSL